VERFKVLRQFTREVMRDGVDFGVIPGTGGKPTLLKPGAEKLCTLFGLHVEDPELVVAVEDWTGVGHGGEPFFYYQVRQKLTRAGVVIASQLASCNSWEKKYRWRQQERKCPRCGAEAIRFSKDRPEWYCWRRVGGCGATFPRDHEPIAAQKQTRVPNPDIFDQVNTILKVGTKRALIAATLVAVNASEFYTADLEDLAEPEVIEERPAPRPARAGPAAREPGEDDPEPALPKPGAEFVAWLDRAEADAVRAGLCTPGGLKGALVEDARRKSPKASADPAAWKEYGVSWAVARVDELLRQYKGLRGENGNGNGGES
jgi:hypothetical protein